jgi:hypothetical protein
MLVFGGMARPETPPTVVIENSIFRYTISSEAKNLAFVERATGKDYLRPGVPSVCAFVRVNGKEQAATTAAFADGHITLGFGTTGVKAMLNVEPRPGCVVLTVESISGNGVERLVFLNVPLTLRGAPNEAFGACAISLNLTTRVDALPALQQELRAACETKFGLKAAKVAIVAAPMNRMLSSLQETLAQASELPLCKAAGPWAAETPISHGSYLFNFGGLTESNVVEWIGMTRSLGFTQIDSHGGGEFFRFGDFELNRAKWPDSWESWRRIVNRLHGAGVSAIFHTYSFFIDKRSKYVAPVPDRRLAAFRVFTLAEPLSTTATEIAVNESTADLSTVTGFFEYNSVVLHIDDELVSFGGFSKQPPWRLTGVKRGALGTKAAAHERGASARHLKECFGLFVPDPESSLFEEIAAGHAAVVNQCGFDGIYLDAIDGSSILRGGDECWYWASKFVVEIQKRLNRPVGMEMSAMWHHFWQYRTRWQAWDYPQRGHRRFVELHAEAVNGGLLLPLHLGWWSFQSFNPPQIEPTYPDVMENLGARLIGWNAGISLTAGVDRQALRQTPLFERAASILSECEGLRHAAVFDETTRAKLREAGKEFCLFTDGSGKRRFRRIQSRSQTLAMSEPWTLTWQATNGFAAQPLKLRFEALMPVTTAANSNGLLVADLAGANAAPWKHSSAAGVSCALQPPAQPGDSLCTLIATNSGKVPRNGAWTRYDLTFSPPHNLKDRPALGVEVEGDGSGAMLALRLESPQHIGFGAVADRYIVLDFVGRRSFSLVETESTRWSDYVWGDRKSLYNLYRETVHFDSVESLSVWLQNLAPGRQTRCRLGPIQALPFGSSGVTNPVVIVEGRPLEFPVGLGPGSWIEANGPEDCVAYGARGELIGRVTPHGQWPTMRAGVTPLEFHCQPTDGSQPRARLTVFNHGEEL